jgi:hypothetical protein
MPKEFYSSLWRLVLTPEEAEELRSIMNELRPTLDAESEGNIAFIVNDKRIDVNKLLDDVPSLMAPDVFLTLPEVAQYDFIQAGKCIAFELPTSAAFHLLRATEATLRHLYLAVTQKSTSGNWGTIVQLLRASSEPLPTPLLDNLVISDALSEILLNTQRKYTTYKRCKTYLVYVLM